MKDSALGQAHEGSSASACLPFPGQADSAWLSHLTSIPVLGQNYPVALISPAHVPVEGSAIFRCLGSEQWVSTRGCVAMSGYFELS